MKSPFFTTVPNLPAIIFGGCLCLFILSGIGGCRKEADLSENPYDDPSLQSNPDTTNVVHHDSIPVGSFVYLHKNIFFPTCANSGCHDGTFEPDFRTLQSTYNSLVNKNAIKTDPAIPISKRVLPFNAEGSMLWYRLNNFMPNTSGIMPLTTDPDSDWESNKSVYLQQIKDWIEDGAPNVGE